MRIEADRKLDFDDVLIRPKRSRLKSRAEVDLNRTFKMPHAGVEISGVPVIAANMDTVGTLGMAAALAGHRMFTALDKHYTTEELQAGVRGDFSFITFGIEDLKKIDAVMAALERNRADKICLDVANGYTEAFVEFIGEVRAHHPDKVIMAGNVTTADMTEALILAGADIVKVGIGPGSACMTRAMTGVGYPQISAIIECADAAHGLSGMICADGGCKMPGDVAKAFGAGADFVMLGGMLAGHTESLSDEQLKNLDKTDNIVEYYGMSSETAMNKYSGGVAKHRASEGRVVRIPYRGDVAHTVQDILGGIRSACTYVGAPSLKQLSKRTTFVVKN
ncbi:MAG: GMP reductase [Alphaproteobacteria bacterium]|nr:GMP reductase [Alphaproteobacteria bacterium]MDE2337471.1 GMP reductase [Alphaproteobacteria bacterium]